MCGICGIASANLDQFADEAILKSMCRAMMHRGPDDEGYYVDGYVGLGMRRLSIIDLSTGRQPITNEDESLWIVFNGEIYNYASLRHTLEQQGHTFRTKSDTEVILHAYEEYGDGCVDHLNGMFAFAIWDTANRRLMIARDRLGIKPLYYWSNGERLVFGSELKAVIGHPGVPRSLDLAALDQFLTLEYVPAPRSIFEGIKKLPPGHILSWQDCQVEVTPYWDVPFLDVPGDEATCIEQLTALIDDAVKMRLVSDVPLGAFLSGGIDSSAIVASMSRAMTEPVKTFSIGFGDKTYNELPYARAVAEHFNTDHHEDFLAPDIIAMVQRLVPHLDEPFGDFSIFPTFLVSEMARRHVTVALSGDGGDELFGGYDTYVAQNADRFYRILPAALRQNTLPALLDMVPPQSAKKGIINKVKRFVEGGSLPASLQHTRWMSFTTDRDKAALYSADLQIALNGHTSADLIESYFQSVAQQPPLGQQQYVDIKTYMVDDILTKVDRMSMAASLEARVPLLDHRIVEFAMSLPPEMKLHRGETKRILRRAMADRLPEQVLNKPKQGFSIPLKHWLGGPLLPLMTDLLSTNTIKRRGLFEPKCVSGWVSEHLDGKANHSHRLWALMVFELWCQTTMEDTTVQSLSI